jgi:DNA replication protein DnaC
METILDFKKVAQNFVNDYQIDSENEAIINCLFAYFTGNKEFEAYHETFSLRKGLLLLGPCGTGKTLTLRIFQRALLEYQKKTFGLWHINEVSEEYQANKTLQRYSINKPLAFDELGLANKENLKIWGNASNIIEDLVEKRYYLFSTLGTLTHFTSNLTLEQIKELYSPRAYSRLMEMCNVIKLVSTDRRLTAKPLERRTENLKSYYQTPEERFQDNIFFIINHIRESKIAGYYLPCGVFDGLAWLYYNFIEEINLFSFSKNDKITAYNQALEKEKTENPSEYEKAIQSNDKNERAISIAKGFLFKDFVMREDSLQIIKKYLIDSNKKVLWEQVFPE